MVMKWLSSFPLVLALLVSASPARAQLASQTVAIAVAGPLSGGAALLGKEQKQAVEMAVDEKNASGGGLGGKVVLGSADDRADAADGEAVAQRLCGHPRRPGA